MSTVPQLLQSCSTLTHSERVDLLGAFIRTHRLHQSGAMQRFSPISDPGICQLCGHQLAVAYRAFDLRGTSISSYEVAPDSNDMAQIQIWRRERIARQGEPTLAQPDWLSIVPVHICPEVESEQIWDEAMKLGNKAGV